MFRYKLVTLLYRHSPLYVITGNNIQKTFSASPDLMIQHNAVKLNILPDSKSVSFVFCISLYEGKRCDLFRFFCLFSHRYSLATYKHTFVHAHTDMRARTHTYLNSCIHIYTRDDTYYGCSGWRPPRRCIPTHAST